MWCPWSLQVCYQDDKVIINEFLDYITPHAYEVFGVKVTRVLALPLIWAAYQQHISFQGHDIPTICTNLAERIKTADDNPITRVRLAMQQFGDQLRIMPLHHDNIDGDGVDGGGGCGRGGDGGGGGDEVEVVTKPELWHLTQRITLHNSS